METPKLANRKTAKRKFYGVYTLSVLLFFIVLSSFLKHVPAEKGDRESATTIKADTRLSVDPLLHREMDRVLSACSAYATKSTSRDAAQNLQKESDRFSSLLDSIRIANASLAATEKQDLQALLDAFRQEAGKQVSVVKTATLLKSVPAVGGSSAATEEMNELKGILVQKEQRIQELESQSGASLQEKDRTIASLQSRLNALPPAGQEKTDGAEWKVKYEKMKAAYDKLKTTSDQTINESSALKTAYKEVVEDNRRLLNQLQTSRSGKN